jgi:hypothetical protein
MDSKPHDYEVKKPVVEEHKGFMDTIADKAKAAGTAVKEAFTAAADNVKAAVSGGNEHETKGSAYDASHWTADQANIARSAVAAGEIRDIDGDVHKSGTDTKYEGLGGDVNRGFDFGKDTKYQPLSSGEQGVGVDKELTQPLLGAEHQQSGTDTAHRDVALRGDTQHRAMDYGTGMGERDRSVEGDYNQDFKLGSEQRGLGIGGDVNQGGLGVGGDRHQRAVDFGKDRTEGLGLGGGYSQALEVGGGVNQGGFGSIQQQGTLGEQGGLGLDVGEFKEGGLNYQGGLGLGSEQRSDVHQGGLGGGDQHHRAVDFGKDSNQQLGVGFNQSDLNQGGLGGSGNLHHEQDVNFRRDSNQQFGEGSGLNLGSEGDQQNIGKEKRASDYQPINQIYNQPTR